MPWNRLSWRDSVRPSFWNYMNGIVYEWVIEPEIWKIACGWSQRTWLHPIIPNGLKSFCCFCLLPFKPGKQLWACVWHSAYDVSLRGGLCRLRLVPSRPWQSPSFSWHDCLTTPHCLSLWGEPTGIPSSFLREYGSGAFFWNTPLLKILPGNTLLNSEEKTEWLKRLDCSWKEQSWQLWESRSRKCCHALGL